MAIIRFKPIQDISIYSSNPSLNAGLDEILDLSKYQTLADTNEVSRILLKFDNEDINKYTSSLNFSMSLGLYLANAVEVKKNTIQCYNLSKDWVEGVGRTSNNPPTIDGCSWDNDGYNNFFTSSAVGTTSSFDINVGGGGWFTNLSSSFNGDIEKLDINITNLYPSSSLGFILKYDTEFDGTYTELKYFSKDTHTIYSPYLELKYDDHIYYSGSIGLVDIDNYSLTLNSNNVINDGESKKIKIGVRNNNPLRYFSTSSLYSENKRLPETSYYSIFDIKANESIIDFSPYTQLSLDNNGETFFVLDSRNLYYNRYYKIKIKSIYNGNTIIKEIPLYLKTS